jgi:hypothetical protein
VIAVLVEQHADIGGCSTRWNSAGVDAPEEAPKRRD